MSAEQGTLMTTGVDFAEENSTRYGAIIRPFPEDPTKTQLIAETLASESIIGNDLAKIDSSVEDRRIIRTFTIGAGYALSGLSTISGVSDITSGDTGPGVLQTIVGLVAIKLLLDRQTIHWGLRNASIRAIRAEQDKTQ